MTVTTRTAHIDTWATDARPADTHGPDRQLHLRQETNARQHAFVFCTRPWASQRGVTVVTAYLRLYLARTNGGGPITLGLRRITASWNEKSLAWKNRPAVVGADDASATVAAGAAAGTLIEFNVTAAMQAVADGGDYFGFQVAPDPAVAAGPILVAASEATNTDRRPILVVDWTEPPDAPTDLRPGGARFVSVSKPTLSWSFGDVLDPGAYQSAFQVQIDDVETFAAPDYDSGQIAGGSSQLVLAATAYAGLPANGAVRYWRVRVWDDTGRASDWSDPQQVRYCPLGVVAVTTPPSPTPDVRPVVTWTFAPAALPAGVASTAQQAWRALIERQSGTAWVVVADSGLTTGTETSWTPTAPLPNLAASYRARVQIADVLSREAVNAAPSLAEATRSFVYGASGAVPDPTGLAATIVNGYAVKLTWSRAVRPDHWALEADGVIVADDIDVEPAGTAYAWTWYGALPRQSTAIKLHAVDLVSGAFALSPGAPLTVQTTPIGIWLVDPTTGEQVHIAGRDQLGAEIGETAAAYPRLGDRAPVVVTELVRGYEGAVSGELVPWDGQLPRAAKALLIDLRERADLRLVLGDLNLPVAIFGLVANPTPDSDDEHFAVGFEFVQTGEFGR